MVGESNWTDVSVPLRSGMPVYTGDPPAVIKRKQDIGKGAPSNVTSLSIGAHTGTHIDAPLHFFQDGRSIDALTPEAINGPARVVEIADRDAIEVSELETHNIKPGEIVLFKTRNSALWKDPFFHEDYVFLSTAAARHLVERQIKTVGIDYLSIGGYEKNESEVHEALLGASIWIIESLDLSKVEPGRYELLCLPLRIEGAEAAPARAFLRKAT